MKKLTLSLALLLSLYSFAQKNVGIGTRYPQSTLHIAGSLRVDSLALSHHGGLVIHDSAGEVHSLRLTGKPTDVLHGDGTFAAAATGPSWLTTGNAGVDTAVNFLGTTDNKALLFRVNNIRAGGVQPQGGNVALGLRSLQKNRFSASGGYSNIALGTDALRNNTAGYNVIAIGDSALFNQPGSTLGPFYNSEPNIAIGSKALYTNKTGSANTAVGILALNSTDNSDNTAIGYQALQTNTGNANTALGSKALNYNTSGIFNTGIGFGALYLGGSDNTAVGFAALEAVIGTGNTAVGSSALSGGPAMATGASAKGNYNTAVGYAALNSSGVDDGSNVPIGSNNATVGAYSLYNNVSGYNNATVGSYALYTNRSGFGNAAFGYKALYKATAGGNTGVGNQALLNSTTGIYNTGLGYNALQTNTTGSNNTAVGFGADVSSSGLFNATAIGYNTKVDASNKVRIGNSAVTRIEGQVPFTTPSDGRFKFNIKDDVAGLDFILQLKPVTYQFDVKRFDGLPETVNDPNYDKASTIRHTGFIAQQVERAAQACWFDFSGVVPPDGPDGHYSLSYESFVVPLVRAIQEQQEQLARQAALLEKQAGLLKKQQLQIEALIQKGTETTSSTKP